VHSHPAVMDVEPAHSPAVPPHGGPAAGAGGGGDGSLQERIDQKVGPLWVLQGGLG